jgi:hypothetical protein
VVAATTSPPTTKTRSSTRTTATPTIPISVVGDLCFDACFSQLEPKPPSGGQKKNNIYICLHPSSCSSRRCPGKHLSGTSWASRSSGFAVSNSKDHPPDCDGAIGARNKIPWWGHVGREHTRFLWNATASAQGRRSIYDDDEMIYFQYDSSTPLRFCAPA